MEIDSLIHWFLKHKRDLPWRGSPSAYQVWISEIMLQQTRVEVVIGYFSRWMEYFPDLATLAEAKEDDVVKCWEGLGYYSRARNILKTAQLLVRDLGKTELPTTREELESLPGVGPYTAGAILSFAFGKKAAAVDGNVMRVISRLFNIHDDIGSSSVQKRLASIVEDLLPDQRPEIVMEGLIELGALVCQKAPRCTECPMKKQCKAALHSDPTILPCKTKKALPTPLYRYVFCVTDGERLLVKRVEKGAVMAGLWEFPYIEVEKAQYFNQEGWQDVTYVKRGEIISFLDEEKHTFTRFRAHLKPLIVSVKGFTDRNYSWVYIDEIETLPFSSGHRNVLKQFMQGAVCLLS